MRGSSSFVAWRALAGLCLVGLSLAGATPAAAQILSPGKLSQAHAHLEGVGNCTQCHQLRTPGVNPGRCLTCHEHLATRIREGAGYHGHLADPRCGACHKEHLGRDFQVVHFDAAAFVHDSTGYTLRGRHADAECRDCHRPEWITSPGVREFKGEAGALARTFLGLGTECASCHAGEDPHGPQFADRSCGACHDEEGWDRPRNFDHSRTAYPLTGAHRDLECGGCHQKVTAASGGEMVRYRPVASSDCRSCHEDPHRGSMAGRCDGCHETGAWGRVRTDRVEVALDHGATGFPLEGAHADAACEACHDPGRRTEGVRLAFRRGEAEGRAYPRPLSDACTSCHLDPHEGETEDRTCDTCHRVEAWTPSRFDLELHDRESRFELTGAHRVTPCDACHRVPEAGEAAQARVGRMARTGEGATQPRFRFDPPDDCGSCHREEDPHKGAFGATACEVCHDTESFLMETFDHQRPEVRTWIDGCEVCHGEDQPHGEQFQGRGCNACHDTEHFRILDFDHSTTRFPLDGAHQEVACGECHRREPGLGAAGAWAVRYRPLATACVACHGGDE